MEKKIYEEPIINVEKFDIEDKVSTVSELTIDVNDLL